ncbi:hypothetical protein QQ045_010598 [Rhodiola kirilowii]
MALDSRAQSFYAFGGSSSSAQVGFLGHMMRGGGGAGDKVLSISNDGSLISFEESYEAAATGQCYEDANTRRAHECFVSNNSSSLESQILAGESRSHLKGKVNNRDEMLDWFYSSDAADDQTPVLHKLPDMDESYMPPSKKQCTSTATPPTKKSKAKQQVVSKDPQSIAAKNRRERISERLKILQELVPNGTKVDLVTMLEKAIGYVKFLQLQVKVLAADEFWPVQGGKAPELSQVKDAIDAILSSSQRSDKNSASD